MTLTIFGGQCSCARSLRAACCRAPTRPALRGKTPPERLRFFPDTLQPNPGPRQRHFSCLAGLNSQPTTPPADVSCAATRDHPGYKTAGKTPARRLTLHWEERAMKGNGMVDAAPPPGLERPSPGAAGEDLDDPQGPGCQGKRRFAYLISRRCIRRTASGRPRKAKTIR